MRIGDVVTLILLLLAHLHPVHHLSWDSVFMRRYMVQYLLKGIAGCFSKISTNAVISCSPLTLSLLLIGSRVIQTMQREDRSDTTSSRHAWLERGPKCDRSDARKRRAWS